MWVKDLLPGINRTNQLSGKIISQPPVDAKAPKEPQVKIDQRTKGNQGQNIVTEKGTVDIQFHNVEKK